MLRSRRTSLEIIVTLTMRLPSSVIMLVNMSVSLVRTLRQCLMVLNILLFLNRIMWVIMQDHSKATSTTYSKAQVMFLPLPTLMLVNIRHSSVKHSRLTMITQHTLVTLIRHILAITLVSIARLSQAIMSELHMKRNLARHTPATMWVFSHRLS